MLSERPRAPKLRIEAASPAVLAGGALAGLPDLSPTKQPLRYFGPAIREALGGQVGTIRALAEKHLVPDETVKMIVLNRQGRPLAFVVGSSLADPDTVDRNVRCARAARGVLPDELAAPVVTPLAEGRVAGVSYAIFPFCTGLGGSFFERMAQFFVLVPALLDWLSAVLTATAVELAPAAIEASFQRPLEHLLDRPEVPDEGRRAIEASLDRLRRGIWMPRHALMHGDLWRGNIMLEGGGAGGSLDRPGVRFTLIDWPASLVRGYPFYDLVRLTHSFRVGKYALRRELLRHCQALRCDLTDTRSYILACLGYLGLTQKHMPFAATVRTCCDAVDAALA